MIAIAPTPLAQDIVTRARAADLRLREEPYYARLLAGDVDRDEYAAWLVQLHKYVRHTVRGELGLAQAMAERAAVDPGARALRAHALKEADEEDGHDDLIVQDLRALWGCSTDEAIGRIERAPSAPSVVAWSSLVDLMLARYPQGVVGVALALETIASLQTDEIRANLEERAAIPGVERALSFLCAHSGAVEGGHQAAGVRRAELLDDPTARSAAFFYANTALSLYEGIARWLSERFPARVSAEAM